MKKYLFYFVATFIFHFNLNAQLPNAQIYVFDFEVLVDSSFAFSNPKYLTNFNADGYNNQPCFFDDNLLYLTAQKNSSKQSDIISLNLSNLTKTFVTKTATSEYSPTITPDGKHFTAVRVEEDNSQRLWKFPIDQSNNGTVIFEDLKDIGYHFWVDEYNLALFIVGEPHSLTLAKPKSNSTTTITSNIGRCFGKLRNGNLVFIHKIVESNWSIKSLDLHSNKKNVITYSIPGAEDFVIMEDDTIIMGSESKLYKFNKKSSKKWVQIADFSKYNINKITRLAIHKNKLAIVSQ